MNDGNKGLLMEFVTGSVSSWVEVVPVIGSHCGCGCQCCSCDEVGGGCGERMLTMTSCCHSHSCHCGRT